MQYIDRLPLLFALLAAILSGVIGLSRSMANDRILLQMIITMVIFYVVGIFVRYNLFKINAQAKEKKINEDVKLEKKLSRESKENVIEKEDNIGEDNSISEDDFEPLKVSQFIREELKKSDK